MSGNALEDYGPSPPLQLQKPDRVEQAKPPINALDDIGMLIRSLTYGEMIQLAEGLWGIHDHESEEDEITAETLPGIWWKWSIRNA
jgi:hypothetical protein